MDVFVVLTLAEFVSPRIPLQKLTYRLLHRNTRIEWTFDGLPCEGISPPISLHMLLNCISLVTLPTISHNWIFHQLECYLAGKVFRNCEYYLLIARVKELLHFFLFCIVVHSIIFSEVFLVLLQSLQPCVSDLIEFDVEYHFFCQVYVPRSFLLHIQPLPSPTQRQGLSQPHDSILQFLEVIIFFPNLCQTLTSKYMSSGIGGVQFDGLLCIFKGLGIFPNFLIGLGSIREIDALDVVHFLSER